jgi:hypothetical protein
MTVPDHIQDLDVFMAAVTVHKLLVEHCNMPSPKRADLAELRRAALNLYDEQIDELGPDPEHKRPVARSSRRHSTSFLHS